MFRKRASLRPPESLLTEFKDKYGAIIRARREESLAMASFPLRLASAGADLDPRAAAAFTDIFEVDEDNNQDHLDLDLQFGDGWAPALSWPLSAADEDLALPSSIRSQPASPGLSPPVLSSQYGDPFDHQYNLLQQNIASTQTDEAVDSPSSGFPVEPGARLPTPEASRTPQTPLKPTSSKSTMPEREQDQFRFRVKLMAPTAMIAQEEEHPITCLNIRQPYIITVIDTQPHMAVQYRTSIRISFDDEHQRADPTSTWQRFRKNRGLTKTDKGESQAIPAIEWFKPEQRGAFISAWSAQRFHRASFDGFSLYWTPKNNVAETSFQFRCNFLSTDFMQSKGASGVAVRLCCKTEVLSSNRTQGYEMCYCKIKTFRYQGADRKLNNDRTKVENDIDKLLERLQKPPLEIELSMANLTPNVDPSTKKQKLRFVPPSSATSDMDGADEDWRVELRRLRSKIASQGDYSLLYLKGDNTDDPDSHPLHLFDNSSELVLQPSSSSSLHKSSSTSQISRISPRPYLKRFLTEWQLDPPTHHGSSPTTTVGAWQDSSSGDVNESSSRRVRLGFEQHPNPQSLASPAKDVTRVKKVPKSADQDDQEWIEVLELDETYKAPTPRQRVEVTCFYIRPTISGVSLGDDYLRALFLERRNCKAFLSAVCFKCGLDPEHVAEIVWARTTGMYVKVEDETIMYMKEGQEMSGDFELLTVDPDAPVADVPADRYRLMLMF